MFVCHLRPRNIFKWIYLSVSTALKYNQCFWHQSEIITLLFTMCLKVVDYRFHNWIIRCWDGTVTDTSTKHVTRCWIYCVNSCLVSFVQQLFLHQLYKIWTVWKVKSHQTCIAGTGRTPLVSKRSHSVCKLLRKWQSQDLFAQCSTQPNLQNTAMKGYVETSDFFMLHRPFLAKPADVWCLELCGGMMAVSWLET